MLAFEPDLKVIGDAGTGREGVATVKELRLFQINKPTSTTRRKWNNTDEPLAK
jgi:hypothetical protein